jgi:hypothetical protein
VKKTIMLLELRQYRIHEGRRAQWLDFFEGVFLPYQRESGLGRVLGYFLSYRDDREFVCLHGFRDADERSRAAAELWGGARWKSGPGTVAESLIEASRSHLADPIESSRIRRLDDVPLSGPDSEPNRVIEIRLYRIRAGQRDRFAEFFNARTVAPQRAAGMRILGQFFDREDENRFIWLRGFDDLEHRDRSKAAFYDGDLWRDELEHEAFSLIEDYSDVWLVRPLRGSLLQ